MPKVDPRKGYVGCLLVRSRELRLQVADADFHADSKLQGAMSARLGVVVGLLSLCLAGGCGGEGGGEEATSPSASARAPEHPTSQPATSRQRPSPQERSEPAPEPEATGGAPLNSGNTAEFETPGGDNSIQRFGREAERSQLARAAAVLRAYLDARFAKQWKRMCSSLAAEARAALSRYAQGILSTQGKARRIAVSRKPPLAHTDDCLYAMVKPSRASPPSTR
jgi:hypothetical protein